MKWVTCKFHCTAHKHQFSQQLKFTYSVESVDQTLFFLFTNTVHVHDDEHELVLLSDLTAHKDEWYGVY